MVGRCTVDGVLNLSLTRARTRDGSDDVYDAVAIGCQNSKEDHMYAAVRTYTGAGAKEFFDLLEKRKSEVEAVMRSVPGLVSSQTS